MRAVGLPALFLAGLAVAAYFFARKKRALGTTRRIQILETASLGPKRSLVIARVGEETLVLGASEAGITLLQSSDGAALAPKSAAAPARPVAETSPAEAPAAAAKPQIDEGPSELDQSLIDALADVPEPDGIAPAPARGSFRSIEGGLASLFGRKAAATAAARVEPKVATTFDDLLEDSVEDQELRRKLAAGMSARVR
jgi:flagellar biogenesis protein FliO